MDAEKHLQRCFSCLEHHKALQIGELFFEEIHPLALGSLLALLAQIYQALDSVVVLTDEEDEDREGDDEDGPEAEIRARRHQGRRGNVTMRPAPSRVTVTDEVSLRVICSDNASECR